MKEKKPETDQRSSTLLTRLKSISASATEKTDRAISKINSQNED